MDQVGTLQSHDGVLYFVADGPDGEEWWLNMDEAGFWTPNLRSKEEILAEYEADGRPPVEVVYVKTSPEGNPEIILPRRWLKPH
jgi:hypothetical protein